VSFSASSADYFARAEARLRGEDDVLEAILHRGIAKWLGHDREDLAVAAGMRPA
jgi:hypothetical protein